MFIFKNADKALKYIIFGILYMVCVFLAFSTETISNIIITFLNFMSDSSMDIESYYTLFDDCLVPIKEAILTYIFFDAVIEISNKNKEKASNNEADEIKDEHEKVFINTHITDCFDVKVLDTFERECKKYQIKVKMKK